ncbi:MAG: SDR family NAD(P)-dependent oxidoreductase [Candidatus Pacebacteria bacterium]|jgi:UDP-glucose 4-epimerase|nr:SDR family NAD(P)-dependent oxidoreductase [Candidatus Paceibacterota bacterium]
MKVLITGGTGTLGKELIKKFYQEWEITVLSRDELKQAQLKAIYPKVKFIIGDIRDYHSVLKAVRGIDVILHCAAMKRIEVCEKHPIEAVKTNVLGTENIIMAAREKGIEKLISISSDKGVEPINVYGMTKAIQEKIVIAEGYNCVRYGNVFGSRGSVVPLFCEQMKKGGPLTVTDPEMTRFILTTDQAIELIMLALNSPMEGKIFVKKSPSARIGDIAESFGGETKVIGKMIGEKMHEMLIAKEETLRAEDKGDHYIISLKMNGLKASEPYTSDKERRLTQEEIKELVKEYKQRNNLD